MSLNTRALPRVLCGRAPTTRRAGRVAVTLVLLVLSASAVPNAGRAQAIVLPPGPNRNLVYGNCRTCHSLQYPKESAGLTRDGWDGVLNDMETYGLDISADDRKKILDYLATYLGPNPPPAAPARGQVGPKKALSGKAVFSQQCIACHQANGQGLAGEFPPLAGNPDLFRSREFPALVLLNGLQGPVTVNGNPFNGQMPSFNFLSDQEIAAVIGYVRRAWGNDANRPAAMRQLEPADIAAARKNKLDPRQVHAYRRAHGGE